jgi:hypothetical protein
MTTELLDALKAILKVCTEQDACATCPMHEFCGKMPCEW